MATFMCNINADTEYKPHLGNKDYALKCNSKLHRDTDLNDTSTLTMGSSNEGLR